jgi:hypothetical protein
LTQRIYYGPRGGPRTPFGTSGPALNSLRVFVIVHWVTNPAVTWTPLRLVPYPAEPSEQAIRAV